MQNIIIFKTVRIFVIVYWLNAKLRKNIILYYDGMLVKYECKNIYVYFMNQYDNNYLYSLLVE